MSHVAPHHGRTAPSTPGGRRGKDSVTARLDRIPVWPYERKLLWIVGAGYFFAFFDIVTISFATPVIATQFHVSKGTVTLVVSGIGFLLGAYATTHFSDRFERKYTTALFALIWAISLVVIGYFASPTVIIVFGFIASATIGLLVPMLYTYTAEHFTTNARATGVALSDGLGHIGGALAPVIVLGANSTWGFSASFLVMAISGVAAGGLILLGIKATGRSLETATAE